MSAGGAIAAAACTLLLFVGFFAEAGYQRRRQRAQTLEELRLLVEHARAELEAWKPVMAYFNEVLRQATVEVKAFVAAMQESAEEYEELAELIGRESS